MGVKAKDFALYKGDNLLYIGTVKEIAKKMNLSEITVRYYATAAYKKRTKENGLVLVPIDYDEDEENLE